MTLTRDERDRFTATTPDDIAYGEGACLETPPSVFRLLDNRFRFDVDLTANAQNAVTPWWFGPGTPLHQCQDALACQWTNPIHGITLKAGYSNPPYGPFIPKILEKAIAERLNGFTSVFLLPNRAAAWFQDLVLPHYSELWYCASRIVFHYKGVPRVDPDTKTNQKRRIWNHAHPDQPPKPLLANGAMFDSIIVVYKPLEKGQGGLFLPQVRPNVWDPRTGELRY